jgi:hypothetical protein
MSYFNGPGDPHELTNLRNEMLLVMMDSCVIQTITNVHQAGGGIIESKTSVTVPCLWVAMRGDDIPGSENVTVEQGKHRVRLPYGTVVSNTSRVVYQGVTYKVIYCPQPHTMGLDRYITVVEMR